MLRSSQVPLKGWTDKPGNQAAGSSAPNPTSEPFWERKHGCWSVAAAQICYNLYFGYLGNWHLLSKPPSNEFCWAQLLCVTGF